MTPIIAKISLMLLAVNSAGGFAVKNVATSTSNSSLPDISDTSALTDLSTSKDFKLTDYPAIDSSVYSNWGDSEKKSKTWQIITMTDAVRDFKETYFYFYHPTTEPPRFVSRVDHTSTFDVVFRISMALTGSLSDYSHHDMKLVNRSSDFLFWKFVVKDDFSTVMKTATSRFYDISELEVLPKDKSESNSFSVSKRFTWSKGEDGLYHQKVDVLNTISLDIDYQYFRVPGAISESGNLNLTADEKAKYITPNRSGINYTYLGNANGEEYFSQNDIFYCTFNLARDRGTLVGAKMEYRMDKVQSWLKNSDGSEIQRYEDEPDTTKVVSYQDDLSSEEDKTVWLRSGIDGPYTDITKWDLVTQQTKWSFLDWLSHPNDWLNGHEAGWADNYSLSSIQKLSPINSSGDFTTGDASDSIKNPYAINSATSEAVKSSYPINNAIGIDTWIMRFDVRTVTWWTDSGILTSTSIDGSSIMAIYYKWFCQHYCAYDTDVLSLTFVKDGQVYTLGVIADSGKIITSVDSVPRDMNQFNWTWLLVFLGIVAIFAVIALGIWALSKAFGGTK